jgi:hypothetical protein
LEIKDTKLFHIYFHELWALSHSIKNKCERLFSETKIPENNDMLIKVAPELHSIISSILSDAANIKKLLYVDASKGAFHQKRAATLRQFITPVHLEEMLNNKVRNSLEHFDEYLDKANRALTGDEDASSPLIAGYNMLITHWEVIERITPQGEDIPELYPIRIYVSSERCFYNMKNKIDIGLINEEANVLLTHMQSLAVFSGDPGGLLVPIR